MNPEEIETLVTENLPLFTEYGLRMIGALLILIAGWVIGNWVSRRVQNIKRLDPMLATFLGGFCKYAILAIAIVAVLGQFGVQTASLLAVLGAAGLAIGLALQGTLSNVAAGVMLLILRPFNVGDYIEFGGGNGGTVKALGLFTTELATPDNVAIFAPNSAIWNDEIYNFSRHMVRRQDLAAGVSYKDDLSKALKVIQDVLDHHEMVLKAEGQMPEAMIMNMGESSVDVKIRFWTKSPDYWPAKWDITKKVKEALDREGISIPFPTRTLEIIRDDSAEKKDTKAA